MPKTDTEKALKGANNKILSKRRITRMLKKVEKQAKKSLDRKDTDWDFLNRTYYK